MNDSSEGAVTKQILVIEDTLSVAELIHEVLTVMGHRTELCSSVEDALTKFSPQKYDLVITDYTMPRMNGIELSHVMRRLAPGQSILLITGSTFSMMDSDLGQYPVNAFLEKPFSIAEFRDSVLKLLVQPSATTAASKTSSHG